ncbi:hypothetical protein [Streptomyces cylindrosporus]|uniref:Uncharacterized protein n=1 Tax=Streptomyces cylindrosporus TaxID=2927583 RepID=A0ABS9YJU4_9ACTN|nr:hypothetical protein [Streptomyces cylindrosporus]MCI3277520.1 hypothetical protein [Streptomyces cylindrosporus]
MAKGQQVLATDLSLAVGAALAALTSAAGTPAAGTVDVTATPTQAAINNNFATIVTRLNAITAVLKDAGILA